MKATAIAALAAQLLLVASVPVVPSITTDAIGRSSLLARQSSNPLQSIYDLVKPAFQLQLHKIVDAEPSFKRPNVKRSKIWYGPYSVPAAGAPKPLMLPTMDPGGFSWAGLTTSFPTDVTVLSTHTLVTYADERRVDISNGVYTHHVAMMDTSKTEATLLSCPGRAPMPDMPMSLFGGTGEDQGRFLYTTPTANFSGGYYIGKNDQLGLMTEVVNYSNVTKEVFTVTDVEYIPGRSPEDLAVQTEVLSVTNCDTSFQPIRPPADQQAWTMETPEMRSEADGYILSQRGHTHDGGLDVQLSVNDKIVCVSEAVYGGQEATMQMAAASDSEQWQTISHMTECNEPVRVSKGDSIKLVVNYDVGKHPLRNHPGSMSGAEEMGMMIYTFARLPNGTAHWKS